MQNTVKMPTGIHGKAFRVFDDSLRNDPFLKAAGVKFRSWKGEQLDATEPTVKESPWVRLTPGASGAEMVSERQTESPLVVNVEIFTQGLIAENVMDLWDYMVQSLYQGKNILMSALGAIVDATGAPVTYHIGQPAFQVAVDGGQPVGFFARGTILVKIRVTTTY